MRGGHPCGAAAGYRRWMDPSAWPGCGPVYIRVGA